MGKFTNDIQAWPLWSQLLLLVVLLLVGHFWLTRLLGTIRLSQCPTWASSRIWNLLLYFLSAAALSWLAVKFCIGTNAGGKPYLWGLYGRVLFIGLTAYLTNVFARYFS